MNYYNDNEPFACEWLNNLIAAGELPQGIVDGQSITEILPDGLEAFTQCHFFAGIGGWPLALKWAGWPDAASVWTGSCPCQPFSQAGKGKGTADERHLWPEFLRLIAECHPATIFGEQVASKAGREWLSGVHLNLEALGYAVGAADLCAAGTGSPHIRQRLFWVADSNSQREGEISGIHGRQGTGAAGTDWVADSTDYGTRRATTTEPSGNEPQDRVFRADSGGVIHRLAHTESDGRHEGRAEPDRGDVGAGCSHDRLGNTDGSEHPQPQEQPAREEFQAAPGTGGHYVHCSDGKTRRIPDPESGIQPLAHGIPRKLGPPLTGLGQVGIRAARANRNGRLRGYGNAIVPRLAAEFVTAYMETLTEGNP